MTEFEKAKQRYEKKQEKQAKVVPIKKEPPKPCDSISVVITDGGTKHEYLFELHGIRQTRISSQCNGFAYQKVLEEFISKEFGRWRLRPTP